MALRILAVPLLLLLLLCKAAQSLQRASHRLRQRPFRSAHRVQQQRSAAKRPVGPPRTTLCNQSDFKQVENLACGMFGCVLLVKHLPSGRLYASKGISTAYAEQIASERRVMHIMQLSAPAKTAFLLTHYCDYTEPGEVRFILEYAPFRTMDELLQKRRLQTDQVRTYAAELAVAISNLHRQALMHRDIKDANLMINGDGHLSLGDFGETAAFRPRQVLTASAGSAEYMAPENIEQRYGPCADWWSFGVVLYKMLTGELPFKMAPGQKRTDYNIAELVLTQMPDFGKIKDVRARDLVARLLTKRPEKRLGCAKDGLGTDVGAIQRHPFLHALDWPRLAAKKAKPGIAAHQLCLSRRS